MVVGRARFEMGETPGWRLALRAALPAGAAFLPAPVLGCTLCHSDIATLLRARVLAPDVWWNACAVAVPLLLLFAVVAIVAFEPTNMRAGR